MPPLYAEFYQLNYSLNLPNLVPGDGVEPPHLANRASALPLCKPGKTGGASGNRTRTIAVTGQRPSHWTMAP